MSVILSHQLHTSLNVDYVLVHDVRMQHVHVYVHVFVKFAGVQVPAHSCHDSI